MSFFSNIFGKSKKNLPDSLSPGTPEEKPLPESVRGGTTLRKHEETPPEKNAGPELSAMEMAERKSWEVKSLPVWKPGDEILGLYRIEDVLEGGMGRVYIAHHKSWNVKLAIKSPNEMMLSDRNNFARVLQEANSWTELGLHPNIAYCYYVRSIEDVPHIFVEYVDGGNLRHWIAEGKCIDYRVSLDLAIEFCHGMEHAHSKGMIHRDIKPENVLITKDGTLKITDFGLVRTGAIIADGKGTAGISGKGMTRLGDVMGTEGFMAPEQFMDAAGVDERADIFSFGVCLYEMCCGARPYDITIGERKDAPDPIGLSRDKKFPPALSEVLTKCVQWERDKRYGTFNEIRERLNTIYRDLFHQESPYADLELVDLEADSLNNRGVSYFELGRREDSLSCWEQALKVSPMHLESTYNLSLVLWRDGKIADDEALRRLENCGNNSAVDKQKLAELKALIHAERWDVDSARDVLKGFPGKYENFFIGKDFNQIGSVRILEGPTDEVTSVALTPDALFALTLTYRDYSLRVWDLANGLCIHLLAGHTGPVKSVAFTPDGRYAVSGSEDKTLLVWEVASGRRLKTLMGHKDSIYSVALTPNGRYAVSGGKDNTLRVWELSSGRCVKTLKGHTRPVYSVAISPDGLYVVSSSSDNTLRVWEFSNGRCVKTLMNDSHGFTSVVLTPEGRYAVSGLSVWELASGKCVNDLYGRESGIYTEVALTLDGRHAVSGKNGTIWRIWDLFSGQCLRTLPWGIISVAITSDGLYAVSKSDDGTLQISKIITNIGYAADLRVAVSKGFKERKSEKDALEEKINRIRNLYEKGDYKKSLSELYETWQNTGFSENDLLMILYSGLIKKGRIKGLLSSFQKRLLMGHSGEVSSIALTPDRRYAVSSSWYDSLRMWELSSGMCVRTLDGYDEVHSVALTPDSQFAVGCGELVWVSELSSGRCVRTLEGHTGVVSSVAITPDGQCAVGCGEKTLWVWEVASGRCVLTLEGHMEDVSSVAITSDGRYAVSGSGYKVWVWELSSGRCVKTLEGHTSLVYSVALTPDGRYAVSASGDKTLRIWDLISGRCVKTLEGHMNGVTSVALTPDGQYAVSGGEVTVWVWELSSGRCVKTLEGHKGYVNSVAISHDSQHAVSGSRDKTLRVWELIWDLEFPDPVDWDEGVRPYLDIFLTLHKGKWGEEDFKLLIDELASKRGYGWVRPEGIRKELEKMTKEYKPA